MAKWSSLTLGYKVGVVLLPLCTLLYLIGFAAPYWVYRESDKGKSSWYVHSGLWLHCASFESTKTCVSSAFLKKIPTIALKFFETMGLLGLATSCLFALVYSCTNYDKNRRLPDVLSGVSGLSGFIGCMIFVGEVENMDMDPGLSPPYGWAFHLNLSACVLTMLDAILLSICNKPTTNPTPAATGGVILARPPPPLSAPAPAPPAGYLPTQPGYYPPPSVTQEPAGYVKSSDPAKEGVNVLSQDSNPQP